MQRYSRELARLFDAAAIATRAAFGIFTGMVPHGLRCVQRAWALHKPETINVGYSGVTELSYRWILQRSGHATTLKVARNVG